MRPIRLIGSVAVFAAAVAVTWTAVVAWWLAAGYRDEIRAGR